MLTRMHAATLLLGFTPFRTLERVIRSVAELHQKNLGDSNPPADVAIVSDAGANGSPANALVSRGATIPLVDAQTPLPATAARVPMLALAGNATDPRRGTTQSHAWKARSHFGSRDRLPGSPVRTPDLPDRLSGSCDRSSGNHDRRSGRRDCRSGRRDRSSGNRDHSSGRAATCLLKRTQLETP